MVRAGAVRTGLAPPDSGGPETSPVPTQDGAETEPTRARTARRPSPPESERSGNRAHPTHDDRETEPTGLRTGVNPPKSAAGAARRSPVARRARTPTAGGKPWGWGG